MMPIRLVIADDHPLILNGLVGLFGLEQNLEVVACCANGTESMSAIHEHLPDVAILDIRMPHMGGLEVVRRVRQEKLNTKLVLLTAELDEAEIMEATQLEVHGIVLKEMAPQLLVQCIRKVYGGGRWLERQITVRTLEKMLKREEGAREAASKLTSREIDLARMVANGLRNKEIAEKLCICEGTVKVHLHNIFDKLQITSRIMLFNYANERGLV
jgi:DNA-binding NarL/FixJ family response regulator